MAEFISEEEFLELKGTQEASSKSNGAEFISEEEFEKISMGMGGIAGSNQDISFGDYLKTVPATAVDIALGAGEGFAAGIGTFTGDYDLARSIGGFREDVNDAIMGDVPDELQSDFAYKIASGLGSTIPYLGAAILSRGASLRVQAASGAFYLSSAGQQVRDDYLGTKGLTSETASDAEMLESTKAGAIGAIPIALAERLGAGAILRPFTRGAIPAGQVMGRIKAYASAGASEAFTEATQSGIINSIAGYVSKYDPDRPITQGMMESALIGFIVGGGVNAGIDTVSRKITQADRLKAGVVNEDINPADVIDSDVGSPLTQIAMENDAIPESNTSQQNRITNPQGAREFISKTLTPISRRLGRAGKEIVREFRNYERRTGVKTKELKERIADFQTSIQKLKKTSPEDYRVLSRALANANELSTSLPNSVERDLAKKAQIQPEVTRSSSEQLLDSINAESQIINVQIEQARKALKSRGLSTRIEIAESGSSFYDPSSNLIVISAEQADGSTVAHEFFHAALGQAVKTDAELQSMTRNMFDSVIRASVNGSSINEQLKGFVSQYDENIQNEEFLAQTVGELARQYQTLDINTKTRVKVWINQAMKLLGMDGVFKQAETDAEVIEQLNAFARFSGGSEAITENMSASQATQLSNGETTPLGEPVRGTKFQQIDFGDIPLNVFPENAHPLSLITKENVVDIQKVMDDVINNNKTVAFFAADQLGVGETGNYNLDGGPSFALTKDGVFWMSGSKDKKDDSTKLSKYSEESDYIFVFAGSPTMHTFNKSVFDGFVKGIESKYGDYNSFRDAFIDAFEKSNVAPSDSTRIIKSLNQFESFDALRDEGSGTPPPRKDLLNFVHKQSSAENDSLMRQFVRGLNLDLDSLRDGFYKENNYGWMDLMMVGKPEGKTQKGDFHSTYADQFMGETLGVPDRKINLKELLSTDKYNELIEKFVSERKAQALKKKDAAFTPEATALRMAKHEGKVSKLKRLAGNPDAQRARVIQEEANFIASKEYTEEQEAMDRARAEEVQSLSGEKINYSAGGIKVYKSSDLRSLRSSKPATAQQMADAADAILDKKTRFQLAKQGYKRARSPELAKVALPIFNKVENGEFVTRAESAAIAEVADRVFPVEFRKTLPKLATVSEMLTAFANLPKKKAKINKARDLESGEMVKLRLDIPSYNKFGVWIPTIHVGDNPNSFHGGESVGHQSTAIVTSARFGVGNQRSGQKDALMVAKGSGKFPMATVIGAYDNATEAETVERAEAAMKDSSYEQVGMDPERRGYFYNRKTMKEVVAAEEVIQIGSLLLAKNPTYGRTPANEFISYETDMNIFDPKEMNPSIRYQKKRSERSASDIERARGLSDEGLRILEKHGMVNSYRNVRGVLDQLKDEYQALGLDMNFIDNYFPRAMKDLEGFKKSIGQTVGIDEEIRRYENMTGQTMTPIERQKMYERLSRSRLYRSGGVPVPSNLKERKLEEITEDQLKFYASAEAALDEYVDRMVQTIETKKLIGDAQSGKTRGKEEIAGTLGQAMEKLAGQGRLRQDQIDVVKGAVAARFGQHGRQYGFVKGMKNAGYLATMGNTGSTLTQLGDFYFTMVQNGLIPTMRAVVGSKALTIEDLGIAKDLVTIETKDGKGFLGKSVDNVFKLTGLTAMDRLAKNTNINAAYNVLTKGAKSNQNSKSYKKTLARLKRTQGNDAYKTIADLQSGKKSDLVVEALYNELADVAPISLTEMPENYAANPNLRILYSLKSYTIKQFNFVRERSFSQIVEGVREGDSAKFADGSVQLVRIMAFGALANGSADVLKAILFNREIDEEDFWWNHVLRLFGVTKYTYTSARKEGVGQALLKTVVPPQFSMMDNVFRDIGDAKSDEGLQLQEMRSMKYMPVVGKLYYWREGKGVEVEERLSRLR